jgi:hypothetical protein
MLEVQVSEAESDLSFEGVAETEEAAEPMVEIPSTDAIDAVVPDEEASTLEKSQLQNVEKESPDEPRVGTADVPQEDETQRNVETEIAEPVEVPMLDEIEVHDPGTERRLPFVRILEIIFGVTAMILVILAIFFRRQIS